MEPARVLVVDDEPGVRESLRMLLKDDCEGVTRGSVAEALRAIGEAPPDLILLDLVMPGRSGFDLLAELSERSSSPPVIVLTATKTVATAVELGTQHVSAYALTVELGTALSRAVRSGSPAPDEDDLADKYELLADMLPDRLNHYEVSNWAETGRACRYNLTTWAQGEYLGFGLGAHGHRDGVRRRQTRREGD